MSLVKFHARNHPQQCDGVDRGPHRAGARRRIVSEGSRFSFAAALADARRYSWALRGIDATPRPGWHERAACKRVDTAKFFGGRVGQIEPLCSICPVRLDCLAAEHRAEAGQPRSLVYGTRGGTTAMDRWYARRETARDVVVAEEARTA